MQLWLYTLQMEGFDNKINRIKLFIGVSTCHGMFTVHAVLQIYIQWRHFLQFESG